MERNSVVGGGEDYAKHIPSGKNKEGLPERHQHVAAQAAKVGMGGEEARNVTGAAFGLKSRC